ncbi:MAG: glutamate-cysteine ligase family protein [Candidatus Omnitrophota bacterium]
MRKKKIKNISMGIELETYSILLPENRICRELHFPRRSSVEKGEKFTRDLSIGSEYNSRVLTTLREALFLLKTGLRKYAKFRRNTKTDYHHIIFPIGGWIDRFAGSHIHLAMGKRGIEFDEAGKLSSYLHSHIPFLIALCANSPVWRRRLTTHASSRLFLGSDKYCKITKPETLNKTDYWEMIYNREGARKPQTLEVRVCDSSLPEYIAAALCVCYAVALRWRRRQRPLNQSTYANYVKARKQAVLYGSRAKLVWSNHWITVPQYVDLIFRQYKEELKQMDLPHEVIDVFKYLKRGWNQSDIIRAAVMKYQRKHKPTWQRQFASRYVLAIEALLDGNSVGHFAKSLGIMLPRINRTWLGRKETNW